jgi:hypothetical protein
VQSLKGQFKAFEKIEKLPVVGGKWLRQAHFIIRGLQVLFAIGA